MFLNCLICSLGQYFTDTNGSKYMLVHSLSCSLGHHCTALDTPPPPPRCTGHPPPPMRPLDPPLKSDLFLGNIEILDPPFKNPGHAPVIVHFSLFNIMVSNFYLEIKLSNIDLDLMT